MIQSTPYAIQIVSLDLADLAAKWQALESRAEPNFFLSWTWVSTWLQVFRPDCQIAEIYAGDQLVGLGLVTIAKEIRHGVVRSRVLRLGQTGDSAQDQIWIEYNDLLLDRDHCDTVPPAFVNFLLQRNDWDEFQVGASIQQRIHSYHDARLTPVLKWSALAYGVDLAAGRRNNVSYLQTLSRNTRHQINRSERLYQETGPLQMQVLASADDILVQWDSLSQMHIARWGAQMGQSGFVNPAFVTFHRALIVNAAKNGQVEFITLHHAQQAVGCLYNFLYGERVYFYLSGLAYSDDARLKPGLLIHALAIEHYKARGFSYYDFLGGDARYKQSLGQPHAELQLVSLQRNRVVLKLEQAARTIKNKVRGFRGQDH